MKPELFKEYITLCLNDGMVKDAIYEMMKYIADLEKRIEKLEAKDFTRNEPLIGDY